MIGAWSSLAVATALKNGYENDRQSHLMSYMPIYGDQVPRLLANQQCHVGMVLDMLVSEADKTPIAGYQKAALGHFVIAVAVNAKSPVRTLSLEDAGKIFAGQIANWKEIADSRDAAAIEFYHPPDTSTEYMIFEEKAMPARAFLGTPTGNPAALFVEFFLRRAYTAVGPHLTVGGTVNVAMDDLRNAIGRSPDPEYWGGAARVLANLDYTGAKSKEAVKSTILFPPRYGAKDQK